MAMCHSFQNFLGMMALLSVHRWQAVDGAETYILDDSTGVGRVFDGIGGISGGGATSRLLVSYPEPQRSQILDYLFKPNFGASLHILKVEIGGDSQTTDGTEASHMHTADDENYLRGYEWWIMTEAKKRNPSIKLYGLPWAFPGWVGKGSGNPYTYPATTAGYIVKWITGAKAHYNLDIDYIGIWNERAYNATYIKVLRKALDDGSLGHVQIVAADGSFDKISADVLADPDLYKAVAILGAHYPGTYSDMDAMKSGKSLWASEDYSSFNDNVGAGYWARILNQNYVNGHMTSTIAWNLIASYYAGLPFFRNGLMTAIEPWSGHYVDNGPLWISAHTTQFTRPGMNYLGHGNGVGHLSLGGSYITFFDVLNYNFTIVIETMSHNQSVCIRPSLPPYTVTKQTAVFLVMGNLKTATMLNLWVSNVRDGVYFKQLDSIKIQNGQFSIDLEVDHVYTLSTLTGQSHASHQNIPESQMFPVPYYDNFDSYPPFSEADLFADQSGVFEIATSGDESFMRQVVTAHPITTCNQPKQCITIIGNISWVSVSVEVQVRLEQPDTLAYLAAGVNKVASSLVPASGIYVAIISNNSWAIYGDHAMTKLLASGEMAVAVNTWYNIMLQISSKVVHVTIGSAIELVIPLPMSFSGGYIGFGTGGYYPADFDNFKIIDAASDP